MHLYDITIVFVLAGLVFYTVLGGADFGAGMWQLTAGGGEHGREIRDHAHHSMAPVWEANHVWLIFVLTVFWTCFPTAFGAIFTTLAIPLFLAGLGIVLRGTTYALRAGARTDRESRAIDTVFALSSLLTPFALGAAIGGIAARRVPAPGATGPLFSSWLNPTSILIGVIAVFSSGYLAAVYLAADAARRGEPGMAEAFRQRALGAGLSAGAIAVAGLVVIHGDAHFLYHGLSRGAGLGATLVSLASGAAGLVAVWAGRFEPARYLAAVAVAAIVAGWALAQQPLLLPGLTLAQAAAPHETQLLIVIAVTAGGCLLFPSLGLLFRLFLGGTLHDADLEDERPAAQASARDGAMQGAVPLLGRAAVAALIAGSLLLVFANAWWAQLAGVLLLLAALVLAFVAIGPAQLAGGELSSRAPDEGSEGLVG
jgi:cytochrome d ubiquinol oxidase subunit II